jgi:hypothetical protein
VSVGSDVNTESSAAYYADRFMWTHNDSLVLFAAGNAGDLGANTVYSPATFKSGVAVGSSLSTHDSFRAYASSVSGELNHENMASYSARGPTSDGRLKPDVLAAGMM